MAAYAPYYFEESESDIRENGWETDVGWCKVAAILDSTYAGTQSFSIYVGEYSVPSGYHVECIGCRGIGGAAPYIGVDRR